MSSEHDGTPKKTIAYLTLPPTLEHDKARALRSYCRYGVVSRACVAASIGRTTWYRWRQEDPAFDSLARDAEEAVGDRLEAVAIKRATKKEGASDTLLIFLLKSLRRERFGDKHSLTITSPDVVARLEKQVAVITSKEEWKSEELLDALDAVWG
jgi:hypothetical protein